MNSPTAVPAARIRRGGPLRRAGRRLKRKFRPGALILMYHRVLDLDRDPCGLCVSPGRFAAHMEVLRRYAEPMPLDALVDALDRGRVPPRAAGVTFDDGYFDVLQNAKPVLGRLDVPATLFAISGFVVSTREMWWDELERLVFGGCGSQGAQRAFEAHYQTAASLEPGRREEFLARLRNGAAGMPACRPTHRGLCAGELLRLTDGGLVRIGAHTVTHPRLSRLGRSDQRSEIRESRFALEEILGRPVTAFSYPHGAFGGATLAEVEEAGFRYACSSAVDLARPRSARFRLPRVVARNWDAEEFEAHLRFWFEG